MPHAGMVDRTMVHGNTDSTNLLQILLMKPLCSLPRALARCTIATSFSAALSLSATAQESAPTMPDEEETLEMISIENRYGGDEDYDVDDDLDGHSEGDNYQLVETQDDEDWEEPPSPEYTAGEELQRLFGLYRDALENKAYLEADTLAKRIVELSIELNGLDSRDSARAITNLAIAQHNNKDYDSALLNFQSSIDIIERIEDRLSPALINPLRGLAASQAATGRPDLARRTFQRAVHVSHVNEGPHNFEQIETLESIAELNISVGELDDALDIQQSIYSIQSRNIDPKSLDIIPALQNKAQWQHRLQRYHSERMTWRQLINVIEKHEGKESLKLIDPLTSLGKSYLFFNPAEYEYQPHVSVTSGESYLRRANKIAKENPEADWETETSTLLSLGDYYILSSRPNRASKTYEDAWELLSDDAQTESLNERMNSRRDYLERVNRLQKVYPAKYYNSERTDDGQPPPENFAQGTVSFSFTVAANGRVTGLKHLETQPADIKDFHLIVGRSLRRMVYRPRFNGEELVPTSDVVFTHEFYYRPSDLVAPANDSNVDVNADPAVDEETG